MDQIRLYSFEDRNGNEDTFTTYKAWEAREYAQRYKLRMIAQIYEYADSDLVEDHTEGEE